MGILSFRQADTEALIASFTREECETGRQYYLTIGAEDVTEVVISMPGTSSGCQTADGSPYHKGDILWLESLDGYSDLRGLEITALNEKGEAVWSASVPDGEENRGRTDFTQDGWTIQCG